MPYPFLFILSKLLLYTFQDIQGRILTVDYVIPVFTILQFIFYFGWLKVAEAIMNPYGEDDDDFDMNWLVDRNLQVGYCIVEDVGQYPPTPVKDIHWYNIYIMIKSYLILVEGVSQNLRMG